MRKVFVVVLVVLCMSAICMPANAGAKINSDCTCKGIPLYGKVQIVNSFADFKVKVTTSSGDLKVQKVSSFADSCGKWKFVDSFPDFKIQLVDSFEDFSIKYVNSFPGRP